MTNDPDDEAGRRRDEWQVLFRKHGRMMRSRKVKGRWVEAMHSDQDPPGPPSGPTFDQLEWVRVGLEGLRHSQNIAVTVLGIGMGLLGAVMLYYAAEVGNVEEKIGSQIKESETRIMAQIDRIDGKSSSKFDSLQAIVNDTRERIIKLETQTQGISEQLARFQRGALDFELLPDPMKAPDQTKALSLDPAKESENLNLLSFLLEYCKAVDAARRSRIAGAQAMFRGAPHTQDPEACVAAMLERMKAEPP
jgi:hypothetical protein